MKITFEENSSTLLKNISVGECFYDGVTLCIRVGPENSDTLVPVFNFSDKKLHRLPQVMEVSKVYQITEIKLKRK